MATIQKRQIRTDASTFSSNIKRVANYGFVCVCLQTVRWQSILKCVVFSATAKDGILN